MGWHRVHGVGADSIDLKDGLRTGIPPAMILSLCILGSSHTAKRHCHTLLALYDVPGVRLKIYGSAWDHFSLQDKDYARLAACCWQGRLPSGSIARLYANATVILGTTDSSQRRLGMVNNRVFEALACSGGQFVAVEERGVDFFSELVRCNKIAWCRNLRDD